MMREVLHEMTAAVPLVAMGAALLLVGALFWQMPRWYRGLYAYRALYAARLRSAGEVERARKVEAETALLRARFPFYGRILMGIGAAVLLASVFAPGVD